MAEERSLGEWLRHLESLHPRAIDLGLERVAAVAEALRLLPARHPVVTVAGTNGKGSVVHCLDAVLASAGLRTGRYTSPHLLHFSERITVAGLPAHDDDIVAAFAAIESARGDTSLSYFEFSTLAALLLFARAKIEVAILEVGLGGRLDAVNIVDADVAVITAIDLDHQEWLGQSLDAIGREKAGIGRTDQPVVLAEANYPDSVEATLQERRARPLRAGRDWHWDVDDHGRLSLACAGGARRERLPVPAGLRAANVAAALQAAELLLPALPDAAALGATLGALQVPARRQRLVIEGRELVLDVAHNPAAMGALARWLRRHPARGQCYAALGVMGDKDIAAMAGALAPALNGAFAVALPGIARAACAERVWQVLDSLGVASTQSEFTIEAVWDALLARSAPGDRLVFCGSFHTVAGIMAHLHIAPYPAIDQR